MAPVTIVIPIRCRATSSSCDEDTVVGRRRGRCRDACGGGSTVDTPAPSMTGSTASIATPSDVPPPEPESTEVIGRG